MNTQEFLSSLEPYTDQDLIFNLGERTIKAGYHVTEIKSATIQAMDCGGQGAMWSETVVQLWTPDTDEAYMSVAKFLNIYNRVAAHISISEMLNCALNMGTRGAPAISYLVSGIHLEDEKVMVRLEPPFVTCKAAERLLGDELTDLSVINVSCCTPDLALNKQGTCCD